jgi:CheY-like chemotaxis protein
MQTPAETSISRTSPRTLLLVDEEPGVLNALTRLLRQDGYSIFCAGDGEAGLQILREQAVDVILSGQRMVGMTGEDFLRQAKMLQPDNVRMLLTGYLEINTVARTVNEGSVYKFLTKPWNDEQLRATVADAFIYKEFSDENRRLTQELAETNQRLQLLLEEKQQRIQIEENALKVLHEVTQLLPLPLLGVDDNGMVASTNEAAQHLFVAHTLMLGCQLSTLLPSDVLQGLQNGKGDAPTFIAADGKAYTLLCRPLGLHSQASGKLIIFMPQRDA